MKFKFFLLLSLLFFFSVSVHAAEPRFTAITPSLSFSNQTATCKATIIADSNDEISVVMKLWEGTKCIKTWKANDTGYLSLTKTTAVTSGKAYKLTVDATIDGIVQPTQSDVGICDF